MNQTSKPMLEMIEEELQRLRKIRNLLAHAPIDALPTERATGRRLSPEARQRIVDAQKRRWAAERSRG